ncbi:copper chaperone PCu(A)C [Bacteriovorax sp. Seq25_V]|uniref:copper chaperone PCu(A)C n=1 Tax=Bacteriovorax sp. Seq25_V TaxID=1201288 RepID=UPI000389EC98|nr:copper chaperone PCu(A)C [Bacteriovorax sp. Seq25_V]EQC43890.1 PF04314 family protein [Bacteriovorax sp. Seq25_V]
MKLIKIITLVLVSLTSLAMDEIHVVNPTIKILPPGSTMTSISMNIMNHSKKDIKLLGATGEFAKTFELHSMEMSNGMMKMRKVDQIEIKKDSSVELKSGGYHVMVFGLKSPLKEDQVVNLKLLFDDNKEVTVDVKAKSQMSSDNSGHGHHH